MPGIPSSTPLTYQFADLISDVRGYVDGRQRSVRNKLNGAITDLTTNVIPFVYDLGQIVPGSQLSVDLETMYVWSTAGSTATVDRGVDGSVATIHDDQALVLVNPEFTTSRIFKACNAEIAGLSAAGIYQIKTILSTLEPYQDGYDLAADCQKVLDVRWQRYWDTTEWTELDEWDVAYDLPTTSFPSGVALFLPDRYKVGWWYAQTGTTAASTVGRPLSIRYKAALTQLQNITDDVIEQTGIPESAVDIIAMGAALRLMSGRAIQRTSTLSQPDPRNSAEVPVSSVLNAGAALRQQYMTRVAQEADELSGEWVIRTNRRRLMEGNGFTGGMGRRW